MRETYNIYKPSKKKIESSSELFGDKMYDESDKDKSLGIFSTRKEKIAIAICGGLGLVIILIAAVVLFN